jgi:hypothetical protein
VVFATAAFAASDLNRTLDLAHSSEPAAAPTARNNVGAQILVPGEHSIPKGMTFCVGGPVNAIGVAIIADIGPHIPKGASTTPTICGDGVLAARLPPYPA